MNGVGGSGTVEPAETHDYDPVNPSGKALAGNNYDQVPVAGLITTKFGHGSFWGSGAPGADLTTHSASSSSGGGKICFENLSSTPAPSGITYNVKLKNAGGQNVNPYDVVITGIPAAQPQGTITVSLALGATFNCVYVSPNGTCYHAEFVAEAIMSSSAAGTVEMNEVT